MFAGNHSKALIEKVYVKNNKNFEATLNIFLSGDIP